jgi:hypothetical protein
MSDEFLTVPPVGQGADVPSDIDAWISSTPMNALVQAFLGESERFTPATDLSTHLDQLDMFTERWDTRQGKERDQAEELPLTSDQEDLVLRAATALGFRETRSPRHQTYDHVMMLGGLFRACITRPAHAAALIREGAVETPMVTALGGHRPFSQQERQLAESAGFPNLGEEFEALDAGTKRAFGLLDPSATLGETFESPGGSWTIHEYDRGSEPSIRVAAAPSSDPGVRRANTADSYKWWANHVANLGLGNRVLAVTTAIYVPAQQAAAIRMLTVPFGVEVDTVGIEPGDVDPSLAQPFSATKYLLEVRSAVRSLRDLQRALTGS